MATQRLSTRTTDAFYTASLFDFDYENAPSPAPSVKHQPDDAFAPSDRLFVSVMLNGNTILNREFFGYSSPAAVVNDIRLMMTDRRGIANIRIRNCSRGTATTHTIALGAPVRFSLSAVAARVGA